MRPFVLSILLFLAAGIAAADPCATRVACVPARKGYAAPAPYQTPARSYSVPYRERDYLFVADANFYVFDRAARDVFVFLGPPPAPYPGLSLGITPDGQDVRGLPAVATPAAPAQDQPPEASLETEQAPVSQGVRPVLGYESQEPARSPSGKAQTQVDSLVEASLRASCLDCHQAGNKPKGQFTLFDVRGRLVARPDWALIKKVTTPDAQKKTPARMPLRGSNKPALPAAVRLEINRRS